MATTTKKKAPAKRVTRKKQEPTQPYSLSLAFAGKVLKASGATPGEALGNLERPDKIMAKGVLTITSPEGSRELLLQPVRIKRLFYNSAGVQDVLAKQLFFGLTK